MRFISNSASRAAIFFIPNSASRATICFIPNSASRAVKTCKKIKIYFLCLKIFSCEIYLVFLIPNSEFRAAICLLLTVRPVSYVLFFYL